jgi:serine/threonine protein kinase
VAVVYKASDLHSDMRHVAVKLFAESQAHTRLGAEFFARECRVLQELRHPAVIDLLDWGTDDATGERLLVLEWTDNTLASRRGDSFEGGTPSTTTSNARSWRRCRSRMGGVSGTRDLKPANVLLGHGWPA